MADSSANAAETQPQPDSSQLETIVEVQSTQVPQALNPTNPNTDSKTSHPKRSTRRKTDPVPSPSTKAVQGSSRVVPPRIGFDDRHNEKSRTQDTPSSPTDDSSFQKVYRRHSTIETNYSADFKNTEAYDRKLLLSLDGGGIRGYSTLLIIKELMRKVAQLETKQPVINDDPSSGPADSSFYPVSPITCVTTDDAGLRQAQTNSVASETSAWLPCHYFDYIAGTSTGGLIGIMLGRLRMNVDDCIAEYEKLGTKVFGHCRWFHLRSMLFFPREKYDHQALERVIRDVVDQRVPHIGTFPGGKNFQFDENRCRVICVAYQEQYDGVTEAPYLFRTYKNLHKASDESKKILDRNPGPAHDIPIYQVGRATSAAPRYFKEIEIEGRRYIDGGFGTNNPCKELYKEVRRMNNNSDDCVKWIISIGTGETHMKRLSDRIKGGLLKFVHYGNFAIKAATDSQHVHADMTGDQNDCNDRWSYSRFNVDKGLDRMKMDEWKARGKLRLFIGRCIKRCSNQKKSHNISTRQGSDSNSTANEKFTNEQAVHSEEESNENDHRDNGNGVPSTSPTAVVAAAATNQDAQGNVPASAVSNALSPPQTKKPSFFEPYNKTLANIAARTEEYLRNDSVQVELKKCAETLVKSRRARVRSDPQRWERACFGIWFQCGVKGCLRGESEYHDMHAMEKHLWSKHPQLFARSSKGNDAEYEEAEEAAEEEAEEEKKERRKRIMAEKLDDFRVVVH